MGLPLHLSSDRLKTFVVCSSLFFFCFSISNANDSLSKRLEELLRSRQKETEEEEEDSLRELTDFRQSIGEDNEIHESTCLSGQFLCSSSAEVRRCINDGWVCDGDRDCDDGEDELNCPVKDCADGQFRCVSDGRCIPAQWTCDGDTDCLDGSDELLCNSSSSDRKPHRSGCPPQSNYVSDFDQCYSRLVAVSVDQSEASVECRRFHPRAHLPAIMNSEQDFFVRHLILKENPELCPLGVWTTGRRSHSFRPFTWRLPLSSTSPHPHPPAEEEDSEGGGGGKERTSSSSEGAEEEVQRALSYTNWMAERPRIGFGQRENCLFIDRKNDFKWNQRRCDQLLCFICQLDLH